MTCLSKIFKLGLSLMLVQSAFAQDCSPPCPPKPCKPCPPKPCPPKPCKPCPSVCYELGYPSDCCIPAAYNSPASYQLDPCSWDWWIAASFTYWRAVEEGLDLAVSAALDGFNVLNPENATILYQDTSYKPGFKIGLGMSLGHDDWTGLLEYTWFRSTTSSNSSPPAVSAGTPVWGFNSWLFGAENNAASSVSSSWEVHMDLLDAELTRPYYQGTSLIVAPFGGLRAQWIRQNLSLSAAAIQTQTGFPPLNATSNSKSSSWALGPRVGFQGEWHLGMGFRLEGDMAGSLLYTQYTNVTNSRTPTTPGGFQGSFQIDDYNCLRAGNDMTVGLGWGTYLDCRNYHLDFLATYDFQVFWNQNMMRQLVDTSLLGAGFSPGNLYLHGLTLRAQFDF